MNFTNLEGFKRTTNENWLRAYCSNTYSTVRLLLEATKRLMKHRGKISGQYATATKIKYSNRKSDENSTKTNFLMQKWSYNEYLLYLKQHLNYNMVLI